MGVRFKAEPDEAEPSPEGDAGSSGGGGSSRIGPREPESAFFADSNRPRLAIAPERCGAAWPHGGQPEWLRLYGLSATQRADVQQHHWTERLRTLLPDSNGAPSSSRREELWQRMATRQLDGSWDEQIPQEELQAELEKLVLQTGLVERRQLGAAHPKPLLFLSCALKAAAEEVGEVSRRKFRLLLMRMHQYLDVHALIPEVSEPHGKVRRELYHRLLRERAHVLKLKPRDKEMLTEYKVFEKLGVPGDPTLVFDRLARWSMTAQFVRPGSGSEVIQPRYPDHCLDPASVGVHGLYNSAHSRGLSAGGSGGGAGGGAPAANDDDVGGGGSSIPTFERLGKASRQKVWPTHHIARVPPPTPLRKPATPRYEPRKKAQARGKPNDDDEDDDDDDGDDRHNDDEGDDSEAARAAAARRRRISLTLAPVERMADPSAPTKEAIQAAQLAIEEAEAKAKLAWSAERAARAAAKAAALRVAQAARESGTSARVVAGNTIVNGAEGLLGRPSVGSVQLLKQAQLVAAGGALLVRTSSPRSPRSPRSRGAGGGVSRATPKLLPPGSPAHGRGGVESWFAHPPRQQHTGPLYTHESASAAGASTPTSARTMRPMRDASNPAAAPAAPPWHTTSSSSHSQTRTARHGFWTDSTSLGLGGRVGPFAMDKRPLSARAHSHVNGSSESGWAQVTAWADARHIAHEQQRQCALVRMSALRPRPFVDPSDADAQGQA
jgi:hypothetical protein